jgi:tRNA G18 (ribose-2'-O)-methylase SpoU
VIVPIDDAADSRVADYVGLRDGRTAAPIFIAEGITVLERLLRSPYPVRSVFVSERKLARVEPLVAELDVPVYVADDHVLKATVGFDLHRGVVAAASRLPLPSPGELLRGRSSATPPRSASTRCCSTRAPSTRSIGASCGSRSATC